MRSDQMTPTERLSRAFASTRSVLQTVQVDQLDAATPCASWKVSALINHFIGTAHWAATTISNSTPVPERDYANGDAIASYDQSIRSTLDAFQEPGVLSTTVSLAFGEYSGNALISLVTIDQFTHGWDLARALGHSTDLDPDLARLLLASARIEIPDSYRGADGQALFGPIVEPRAASSAADDLAAFLGRVT
jgi:uncharacterized protein (TIGR03086 family)